MIELKRRDVLAIAAAMPGLDGVVTNGELRPFELSPTVRILIGRWNAALKIEVALYHDVRNQLITQMSEGQKNKDGFTIVPSAKVQDFQAEEKKLMDETVTFRDPLKPLFRSDLLGKSNAIAGTVLGALDPILIDEFR